jgi:hypothetical protein
MAKGETNLDLQARVELGDVAGEGKENKKKLDCLQSCTIVFVLFLSRFIFSSGNFNLLSSHLPTWNRKQLKIN